MRTILITGGTGLIGRALCKMLVEKGFKVIVLSRNPSKSKPTDNIHFAHWDVNSGKIDVNALTDSDCIIHLAGAGVVEKKWTASYKNEIVESRTKSSELIINTLRNNPNHVKTIVSASAIGWYGADIKTDYSFVETDAADHSFLGETCKLWEDSIEPATNLGIRVCKIRTGIVLSKNGGALREFIKPIQWGIAAILGKGNQIISWIHIEDLCRIFIHCIENNELHGSYNAVATSPVSNRTLTITLAKAIKGIFFIPLFVPSFILRLMMGQRSIEVLKSTRVSCEKIKKTGFVFYYPTIETALKNILKK